MVTLSSVAMVSSAVVYILAMFAHAAEWAAARSLDPAPTRMLVGAGGPALVEVPDAAASDRLRVDRYGRIGIALTLVAVGLHVLGVVTRGIAAGRAPWGNMYEFITATLAFVAVAYLVLVLRFGMRWLGLPVTLLLAVGQGLAVTVFYVAVAPLIPALHSVWFVIHIVAAALAGAAFNLGAAASVLWLLRSRAEEKGRLSGYVGRMPSLTTLDKVSYRLHAFAFPLWTFAIAAGSVWAEYAWGRFWGWDPKETWSLVAWVVYAAYLHARVTAGWKGRRAAWLALIGVATFWFNFVGVNLLAGGLHSYGMPN